MADKLLVVLANADPSDAAQLAAPLAQVLVAASMGYEVEMVLTGPAAELARRGFAEALPASWDQQGSVYAHLHQAHQAGVRFKVCNPTLALRGDDLIAEIDETVGAAYVISEAMTDGTVTFTY